MAQEAPDSGDYAVPSEREVRCRRLVVIGPSPTPFVRCGQVEDHEVHDPLGSIPQRHPFDGGGR